MSPKPCKVKRFLASSARSEAGLVSSGSQERWEGRDTQEKEGQSHYQQRKETNAKERNLSRQRLGTRLRRLFCHRCVAASVLPVPVCFGEEEEITSVLQGSAFFSSFFLKLL